MQIDRTVARQLEEENVAPGRGGVEHTIEDRLDQNDTKRIQQSDGGKENNRSQRSSPVRPHVVQQSHQSMAQLVGFSGGSQTGFYSDSIVLLRAIAMLRFYVVSRTG